MLGLRAAPKDMADVSTAEVALGAGLELPGPSLHPPPPVKPVPAAIPPTTRSYTEMAATPPSPLQEGD